MPQPSRLTRRASATSSRTSGCNGGVTADGRRTWSAGSKEIDRSLRLAETWDRIDVGVGKFPREAQAVETNGMSAFRTRLLRVWFRRKTRRGAAGIFFREFKTLWRLRPRQEWRQRSKKRSLSLSRSVHRARRLVFSRPSLPGVPKVSSKRKAAEFRMPGCGRFRRVRSVDWSLTTTISSTSG